MMKPRRMTSFAVRATASVFFLAVIASTPAEDITSSVNITFFKFTVEDTKFESSD